MDEHCVISKFKYSNPRSSHTLKLSRQVVFVQHVAIFGPGKSCVIQNGGRSQFAVALLVTTYDLSDQVLPEVQITELVVYFHERLISSQNGS